MSRLLDAFEQVIKHPYRILPDNNNLLTIIEDKNNSGDPSLGSHVSFRKTGKVFTFTLDINGPEVFPYFLDREGLKGKNDAIIIASHGEKIFVLLLELKSKKPSSAMRQLRGGENFIKYVLSTIQLHFDGISTQELEYRYLLFTTRKIPKKRPTHYSIDYLDKDGKKLLEVDSNRTYALVDFLK